MRKRDTSQRCRRTQRVTARSMCVCLGRGRRLVTAAIVLALPANGSKRDTARSGRPLWRVAIAHRNEFLCSALAFLLLKGRLSVSREERSCMNTSFPRVKAFCTVLQTFSSCYYFWGPDGSVSTTGDIAPVRPSGIRSAIEGITVIISFRRNCFKIISSILARLVVGKDVACQDRQCVPRLQATQALPISIGPCRDSSQGLRRRIWYQVQDPRPNGIFRASSQIWKVEYIIISHLICCNADVGSP